MTHISDLAIDRLLAGELSAAARTELEAHTRECDRCASRVAALTAEHDAFAARPMPIAIGRAKKQRARVSRVWLVAPVIVAAAAAVLLLLRPREHTPTERLKSGDTTLLLWAGTPNQLRPVATNDVIHSGEHLQASYTTKRDGAGAVLSIDGAGGAFSYVPATGDAMVTLPAGRERPFPGSTLLDDVTGRELIAIVWCETSRPIGPLLAELKAKQDLAAPPGCVVRIVTLDKQAAR
ncbi:MAG TPA: hypothetical protein VL326_26490 [Kofleriaceae bacterium]|nr:hypothetical protein [Kofleriaceae bacterium]